MRYTTFYTIKELDYNAIESRLLNQNIPSDLRKDLQTLIDDHKALIKCRNKILEEQNAHANGLFNVFDDAQKNNPIENQNISGSSTEENKNASENPPEENKNNPKPEIKDPKKRENGGKKKLPLGKVFNHPLSESDLKCSCCGGNMHKEKSKTRTYVLALPMLSTETHICESVRCLTCDTRTTATSDDNLDKESIGRYHFTAVSHLAALRYQYGMASYRMEQMSDAIGMKIADSTQWFLFEKAASLVQPFIDVLEKQVANAPIQHTDDTHNIVHSLVKDIEAEQEEALNQGQNPKNIRSGIHTTNITGVFPQGSIVLYKTGIHHAGEILAKMLSTRTIDEQIIVMADASSAITSKIDFKQNSHVKMANCNSHAARKFIESAEAEAKIAKENRIRDHKTSEYLDYFIARYKIIFENDQKTRKMSPPERLIFHIENPYL